jgi:hypothetical protein
MWWFFGLINVVVVFALAYFLFKVIKDEHEITKNDKIALGILLVFAFLSGLAGTAFIGGVLIYLVIDFVRFVKK